MLESPTIMAKKQKRKKPHQATKPKGPKLAELADRHVLYQESVQCAEAELDFVEETFKSIRGRKLRVFREDFCGTANVAAEWVKRNKNNIAIGVDLDGPTLDWGREHNIAPLKSNQRERITLIQENVLTVRTEPVDAISAMNFSYWIFKTRKEMLKYFKRVREGLKDDGVFFLDFMGGYEAFRELEEETEYDDFTYVWDQAKYNPITGHCVCYIHFKFPDRSKMKKAFTYEWRIYTLPEIRDILEDAGFKNVTVYWEGTDEETEEGDGVYSASEEGEADAGWIAYITAEK